MGGCLSQVLSNGGRSEEWVFGSQKRRQFQETIYSVTVRRYQFCGGLMSTVESLSFKSADASKQSNSWESKGAKYQQIRSWIFFSGGLFGRRANEVWLMPRNYSGVAAETVYALLFILRFSAPLLQLYESLAGIWFSAKAGFWVNGNDGSDAYATRSQFDYLCAPGWEEAMTMITSVNPRVYKWYLQRSSHEVILILSSNWFSSDQMFIMLD